MMKIDYGRLRREGVDRKILRGVFDDLNEKNESAPAVYEAIEMTLSSFEGSLEVLIRFYRFKAERGLDDTQAAKNARLQTNFSEEKVIDIVRGFRNSLIKTINGDCLSAKSRELRSLKESHQPLVESVVKAVSENQSIGYLLEDIRFKQTDMARSIPSQALKALEEIFANHPKGVSVAEVVKKERRFYVENLEKQYFTVLEGQVKSNGLWFGMSW